AVLAVLAYHLDLPWAGGGFLGVEVFFTLSGFLITQVVADELARTGRVDPWAFVKARVRRLVPALLLCVLGTLALYRRLRPDIVVDLRIDALASLFYVENWQLLVAGIPYAEAFTTPSPLLHLWSLSVEGQLYLLWPILLVGVLAVRKRVVMAGAALLLGLASAVAMAVSYDPDGGSLAYYATSARASGFLLGAALALLWRPEAWTRQMPTWLRLVLDAVGITALVAIIVGFVETSEFDAAFYHGGGFLRLGLLTVVVILAATRAGAVGALLATAPLVAVGKRSYGLYLYHWPLFVLFRDLPAPTWLRNALALLCTAVVTEASYRWIETPIRRGGLAALFRRLRVPVPVVVALCGCSAVVVAGAVVVLTGPGRTTVEARATTPTNSGVTIAAVPPTPAPATPTPTTAPTTAPLRADEPILVVGDSIALGSADALRAALGPDTRIDAKVSRQFSAAPAIVASWTEDGPIVVALGANGTVSPSDIEKVIAAAGERRLVLVGVRVPRRWQDGNNAALRAAAARHPGSVVLVDWADIVASNPAVLGPDGVHPTVRGRTLLATAVSDAVTRH
ncbi:MAG: acyltransferase, partial [Pseudonocardia sp.]|nr:acyltransferase [Pseudonocardia sp.]